MAEWPGFYQPPQVPQIILDALAAPRQPRQENPKQFSPTWLDPVRESLFRSDVYRHPWAKDFASKFGEAPNLNDPLYDYRGAWQAGAMPIARTKLEDVPQRKPTASELAFFQARPEISGMAVKDNAVVLNPQSRLTATELAAVLANERSRVLMRSGRSQRPPFDLTPAQQEAFSTYGSPQDMRETVAARVLSGDPSAGNITEQQRAWVEEHLGPFMTPQWHWPSTNPVTGQWLKAPLHPTRNLEETIGQWPMRFGTFPVVPHRGQ